jgi:hypothetical protein
MKEEIKNIFIDKIKSYGIRYEEKKQIMYVYLEDNSEESFRNFVDLCLCLESYLYEAVTSKIIDYKILVDLSQEQVQRMCEITGNSARVKLCWSEEFNQIDSHTDKPESPVAEVSRLLTENFEVSNTFGNVNSRAIANIIGKKLKTNRMHEAILKNFDGVRFRRQNGGFTYTLRRRDTTKLKE